GHAAVYRQGGNLGGRIAIFYKRTLPQTYREAAPCLIAAALLLFGPALVAFVAITLDPKLAYALVPAELVQLVRSHHLWTQIPVDRRPLMSGVIMTNNINVSILAFAFGVLLGLPTIYLLMTNGIQPVGRTHRRQGHGRCRDRRPALRVPAAHGPAHSEAGVERRVEDPVDDLGRVTIRRNQPELVDVTVVGLTAHGDRDACTIWLRH